MSPFNVKGKRSEVLSVIGIWDELNNWGQVLLSKQMNRVCNS